jgi:hypothetical protein
VTLTQAQAKLREGELELVRGRWCRRIRERDYFEVLSAQLAQRLVARGLAVVAGGKLKAAQDLKG